MSGFTNSVHVLVAEAYEAIAGDLNAATITAGEITIIDADTRAIATTASKRIQFAVYDPALAADGFTKAIALSPVIYRDNSDGQGNVTYYNYQAYTAPVAMIADAEMTDGGSGISDGLTYNLKIQLETSRPTWEFQYMQMPRFYQVTIPVGTATPENYLAAAFADLINADEFAYCTASDAGDVITLTALNTDDTFAVYFFGDNWIDPTFTVTTAWVRGSGTYAMVAADEKYWKPGNRATAYREQNVYNENQNRFTTTAISSVTYDTFTLEFLSEDASFAHRRSRRPIIVKVYFNSAGTNKAAFKTLLETLVP